VFLDEALSYAGVSIKVRRLIQSIYKVAHGCVRISKPDGSFEYSDVFDINRGVLQGDMFNMFIFKKVVLFVQLISLWITNRPFGRVIYDINEKYDDIDLDVF